MLKIISRSTLPPNTTYPSNASQTNPGNSKKFNIFTSFLSRTKSNNNDQPEDVEKMINNSSSTNNYLNIKNLKRASSSSQFSASTSLKSQLGNEPNGAKFHENLSSSTNRSLSIFNPSNLFPSKSKAIVPNKEMSDNQTPKLMDIKSDQNKYRRSFDDISTLKTQRFDPNNDTSIINKFDENTALSTKNNGLIFLPAKSGDGSPFLEFDSSEGFNRKQSESGIYENLRLGLTTEHQEPLQTSLSYCATNLHLTQE